MKSIITILSLALVMVTLCSCGNNQSIPGNITLPSNQIGDNDKAEIITQEPIIEQKEETVITTDPNSKENLDYMSDISAATQPANMTKVVAYVDNEPIYRYEVLVSKANNDISIAENIGTDKNSDKWDQEFYDEYYKSEQDCLELLIDLNAVIAEAKEDKNITVDEEAVKKGAAQQVDYMKEEMSEYFSNLLKAYNCKDADEYLQKYQIPGDLDRAYSSAYFNKYCPRDDYDDEEKFEEAREALYKKVRSKHSIQIVK